MIIDGKFDRDFFPYIDLQVMNEQANKSATVKAIIDTGAAHCMIQEALARQLELAVLRTADYRHPVIGKMPLVEYTMSLCFHSGNQQKVRIDGVRAGTLIDTQYPAAVIIGVEVLRRCRLSYDGPALKCALHFQDDTLDTSI